MKLESRITALELALTKHLEESGTIRTDLAWLKKAFWTMAGALVTFNLGCVTALITKILR